MSERSGRGALVATILVFGLGLALVNGWGIALLSESIQSPEFTLTGKGFTAKLGQVLSTMRQQYPSYFWLFFGLPLALFGFSALLVGLRREVSSVAIGDDEDEADSARPTSDAALRILALLQQEGRLIDFLEEDIDGYSDEQVGAAVRGIHGGCRKALHERMTIARIFDSEDGASIEVAADYDADEIRLTGNVHGDPPFRGTVEHAGWRVSDLELPETTGGDPSIIAPAEVEIP